MEKERQDKAGSRLSEADWNGGSGRAAGRETAWTATKPDKPLLPPGVSQ